MRHPATRPASGDLIRGPWGERRVAWVTEGLTHTLVGLVDSFGKTYVVSYDAWLDLVHEADIFLPASEEQ